MNIRESRGHIKDGFYIGLVLWPLFQVPLKDPCALGSAGILTEARMVLCSAKLSVPDRQLLHGLRRAPQGRGGKIHGPPPFGCFGGAMQQLAYQALLRLLVASVVKSFNKTPQICLNVTLAIMHSDAYMLRGCCAVCACVLPCGAVMQCKAHAF